MHVSNILVGKSNGRILGLPSCITQYDDNYVHNVDILGLSNVISSAYIDVNILLNIGLSWESIYIMWTS